VRAAVVRLTRLIALGDKTLSRLLSRRPELEFLRDLRDELQAELERVSRDSFALAEGASR
jgi:hypothetical protein